MKKRPAGGPGAFFGSGRSGGAGAGVDGLGAVLAGADGHLPRLRCLGNRDAHGEHALVVVGLDVAGVEGLAEEQLAAERASGPLGYDHLVALPGLPGSLGLYGEHVLLDLEVDAVGLDPGQVEVDVEAVAPPVGIDRHDAGAPVALRETVELAVELAERI